MKFIVLVSFLFASLLLSGQKSEFGWLLGTWQEDKKMSFEVRVDEGSFLFGSVYQMDSAGNKVATEEIKLIRKGDDFYYVPDVAGPQGPVEFKITSFDKNSFIAENPAHDFPGRIAYKNTSARLEAIVSGGSNSILYAFKKIK
jgi:hypothetical protein